MAVLTGRVVSGTQKGQFFLSHKGYQVQLRRILGFDAFAGTLNLRVEPNERADFLGGIRGFDVEEFSENDQSFGALWVYPIWLSNSEPAGIVVPEQTEYDDSIVEIVAPYHLRTRLGLCDGHLMRIFSQDNENNESKFYGKKP